MSGQRDKQQENCSRCGELFTYIDELEDRIEGLLKQLEAPPVPMEGFVGKKLYFRGVLLGTIREAVHNPNFPKSQQHKFILDKGQQMGDFTTNPNYTVQE